MLFSDNRDQLRQMWLDAWSAHKQNKPMIPLQIELVAIIEKHPEYIPVLESDETALQREYLPEMGETNPFLHMAMHQGIHEQLSSNRPQGIKVLYKKLCEKYGDPHNAEHQMIECLAESIWEAQRHGHAPDEQRYLQRLKGLL